MLRGQNEGILPMELGAQRVDCEFTIREIMLGGPNSVRWESQELLVERRCGPPEESTAVM